MRAYTLVLAIGTVACLAVAATVTVPFAVALLATAASATVTAPNIVARLDAVVTLAVLAGFWTLWATAWWHRHRHRVRGWVAAATARPHLRGRAVAHSGACTSAEEGR